MDWLGILSNTAQSILSPATIAYALAALGLALHFGFAGLLNFGIAGFMAIGAYGYVISALTFGLPWWAGMLVGIGGSVVFAIILGIPTLRLRGDYLAIVTIAAAEIVRLLFLTTAFTPVTGSADGLSGYHTSFRDDNPFPEGTYGFGPWTYNATEMWGLTFGLIVLALCVLLLWRLVKSPWGRIIKGIREDEDAVRALGKNVFSYKMQALIIGGVFGALGGIVLALPSAVNPGVYVHVVDVLRMDGTPPRRSRDCVRARPGSGNFLAGPHLLRKCIAGTRDQRNPRIPFHSAGVNHSIHPRGCGAHAPRDLPSAGHSRR
jgi:ABC-type branched-subunit amino acid transport system permease subunit